MLQSCKAAERRVPNSRPNLVVSVTVARRAAYEGWVAFGACWQGTRGYCTRAPRPTPAETSACRSCAAATDSAYSLSLVSFPYLIATQKTGSRRSRRPPATANLRTDRRQQADPQAKTRDERRTTASTASHTAADRQTRSRPTQKHDRESRGTANATKPATNREAQGRKQTKKHDRSTNDGQHATAAGSGTPQTENGTTSKADDREDQKDRQTTQQTPPENKRKKNTTRDDRHGQPVGCAGGASAMPRSP